MHPDVPPQAESVIYKYLIGCRLFPFYPPKQKFLAKSLTSSLSCAHPLCFPTELCSLVTPTASLTLPGRELSMLTDPEFSPKTVPICSSHIQLRGRYISIPHSSPKFWQLYLWEKYPQALALIALLLYMNARARKAKHTFKIETWQTS